MGSPRHDYHVHSDYSDGTDAATMIETAERLGLDGIGFADHVLISHPEKRDQHGYPMDISAIPDRHDELERLREQTDVRIFEAVEIDYYPFDEEAIDAFLIEHQFEYVIGSVHELGRYHPDEPTPSVHHNDEDFFEGKSEVDRMTVIDRYFDRVVRLIESNLVDVIAHLDLIERNPALRGLTTDEHYHAVAAALAEGDAIPEINGTSVTDDWPVLPRRRCFEILREYDIQFVRGSDAHGTASLETRNDRIDRWADRHDISFHTIA